MTPPQISPADRAVRILVPLALLAIVVTVVVNGGAPAASERNAAPAPAPAAAPAVPPVLEGKVLETMDSGGYTYARVAAGSDEIWAAGPATKLATGEVVAIETVMPMRQFESKTLKRTFPLVYFVQSFKGGAPADAGCATCPSHGGTAEVACGTGEAACDTGGASAPPLPVGMHPPVAPKPAEKITGIAKADRTVAEVHAAKGELAGRKVAVRGKVVKVNAGIMNRNWIHLQDGSGEGETADLTVTAVEQTAAVGDIVLATGVVAADKDFGSGYRYDVIMEDATLVKE